LNVSKLGVLLDGLADVVQRRAHFRILIPTHPDEVNDLGVSNIFLGH
jgi:hypothetical protein